MQENSCGQSQLYPSGRSTDCMCCLRGWIQGKSAHHLLLCSSSNVSVGWKLNLDFGCPITRHPESQFECVCITGVWGNTPCAQWAACLCFRFIKSLQILSICLNWIKPLMKVCTVEGHVGTQQQRVRTSLYMLYALTFPVCDVRINPHHYELEMSDMFKC